MRECGRWIDVFRDDCTIEAGHAGPCLSWDDPNGDLLCALAFDLGRAEEERRETTMLVRRYARQVLDDLPAALARAEKAERERDRARADAKGLVGAVREAREWLSHHGADGAGRDNEPGLTALRVTLGDALAAHEEGRTMNARDLLERLLPRAIGESDAGEDWCRVCWATLTDDADEEHLDDAEHGGTCSYVLARRLLAEEVERG